MKTTPSSSRLPLLVALACALALPGRAELIVNGGFESGLTGWTVVNQVGSEGAFLLQSGTTSPILGTAVAAPPQGGFAAMTDAEGPGSRVLYQDFLATALPGPMILAFSLYLNNQAPDYFAPPTLDFATPALNQRARVDILTGTSDPFSLATEDILLSLFETAPGDPLVAGYTSYQFDVTSLLQAHAGQTLRLRFAEVDNVFLFNFGVDAVSLAPGSQAVPDANPWLLQGLALGAVIVAARRRRQPVG